MLGPGLVLVPLLALLATGSRFVVALYGVFNNLGQIDETPSVIDSRLGTPVLVAGVIALGMLFLIAIIAILLAFSSITTALREFRVTHSTPRLEPLTAAGADWINRRIVSPLFERRRWC